MLPVVTSEKGLDPHKKPSGEYRHGDLHNALLDAADRLVTARGGPEFTLREIAEHVGVRHSAAYRHFASKEAILLTLAARGFHRLAERLDAVVREHGEDVRARLKGIAEAYMGLAREAPGAYRVMFANIKEVDDARKATARRSFDTLVAAVADGQRQGVVRADLPAGVIAASNWAALHGLAMLLLDERLDNDGPLGGPVVLLSALLDVQTNGFLAS